MNEWLLWQWLDSAFPAGGLAHSGGLEAAWQAGEVPDAAGLREYLAVALHQAARLSVPFVAAACDAGADLPGLDRAYDLLLSNHVARRASAAQGQAMLAAAARVFGAIELQAARQTLREARSAGHLPVACGLVARALHLPPERAAQVFLFLTLRTGASAAVRLGMVGPLEAQAIQRDLAPLGQELAGRWSIVPIEQAAQTAPLAELLQGMTDRLYSRLFIS
jgi:urease accessory protein